jgi:magnesium chelatase subunit D
VTTRTAKAIAALDGRTRVNLNDVLKAMELALRHRLKSKPFEEPQKRFEEVVKELTSEKPEQREEQSKGSDKGGAQGGVPGVMGSGRSDRVETLLKNLSETPVSLAKEPYNDANMQSSAFSRGSREFKTTAIASFKGVAIDAIPPAKQMLVDVDLPASLRASAALNPVLPIAIRPSCIRVRVRKERIPALHTILLDVSGSMLVGKRISVAKHILKTLMEEAYVKRTFVSLIAFRGVNAVAVVEPTRNLETVFKSLEEIPVGGSTPFTAALLKALNYFKTFKRVFKEPRMVLHIISDGGANVFLTKSPRKEFLELAEEYRRLGVEVVAYHTASSTMAIRPDYMKLFVEAVGGRYYKV